LNTNDKFKKLPYLTKQSTSWLGTPFMTYSQEMEQALFLQLDNPHGARKQKKVHQLARQYVDKLLAYSPENNQ